MGTYAFPVLYTLFIWWFSTGVILYLDGLHRETYRWTLLGATIVGAGALLGLEASAADPSPAGAYHAFTCGLLIWGWHEVTFLTGAITGPRRHACPLGCRGFRHALHAAQAIITHELAILLTAVLMLVLTFGEPNQVGVWTFAILWVMRLSAKLNLFLGVPNLYEEFLPEHLGYLKSFLKRGPMNLLFPVSITVSTVVLVHLVGAAGDAGATPFEATGFAFLATLLALAILEHWFLVIPLPVAPLWRWGLSSRVGQPVRQSSALGR